MTHFSDGIKIGPLTMPRRRGAEFKLNSGIVTLSFVPVTLDRDGYCASQTPGAAGNLTLNGALVSNSIGRADVARSVSIYGGSDESGKTFTVYGYDEFGAAMSEAIAGPNNSTVNTLKAFYQVTRVAVSAATTGAVEVGTGDKFGLPCRALEFWAKWASALALDAGTYVAGVTTSPATTTTGDVRGTYTPSSASNGSRRLTMYITPIDAEATDRLSWIGVTQA